jgi:hypothetical protein
MATPKVHFITYGDGRFSYYRGAKRLSRQALNTGWFNTVTNWTSLLISAIDPKWFDIHKNYISYDSRGHGYWIWKSKIIELTLSEIPEGDILVYIDAGCELNLFGSKRFRQYLDLVESFGFLFFYLKGSGFSIGEWTKVALIDRIGFSRHDSEILNLPQMESGVLFFKNTQFTRNFVKEWQIISVENNYSFINILLANIINSFLEALCFIILALYDITST